MFSETIAKLAVAMSMDAGEFATGSTSVQKELAKLQGAVQSLGDRWMQAGKRLTIGVSAPLAAIGIASAKAASDAQELDSAFGQTFGRMADDMRDWAEATGDALNRSTEEIKRAANAFGGLFNAAAPTRAEAAKMSQTFTVLAQDLASFFNVSESDALDKLMSGLSGEIEPLRDFQVFINEAAVSAKALELGLADTTKEITEQDKILARYNLILEGTKVAQGDVTRTAGSAANQARGFAGAVEDLQVVIGEKLLPILTPLIESATKVVNAFANLPSPVQNVIIGIGALAAAMGPLMLVTGTLAATVLPLFAARFGPIGLAISAFINPLGTAISLLAQFAVQIGGMTILKTIGGLLLRFLGPIGLLATAATLVYQNWDRIVPVFEKFWKTAQDTLGPPLQELMATISALLAEFWNGPMGDGIRGAIALAQAFGAAASDVFGTVLIVVLEGALAALIDIFAQIADAIRFVNALLKGDFVGAWDAATRIVERFMAPFTALARLAVDAMRRLYAGVRDWLQTKLGEVFDWVGRKIRQVTGFFFDMYDAVVGNSYVPDMVDGIQREFARLQAAMVDPARAATKDVTEATRQMSADVMNLLDRLFPEFAAARKRAEELALLDRAGLSEPVRNEARFRLGTENLGPATVSKGLLETAPLVDFTKAAESVAETLGMVADKAETQTVRIAESFRDMAQNSIRALDEMVNAIRGGGFLDILGSAVNLFLQVGSTGLFGKGLASSINAARIPGFAQGTRYAPGGLAWVGERGPELVNLSRGSQVISNRDLRAANDESSRVHVTVGIDPRTGNLTAFVNDRIMESAPAIAGASAAIAQGQMTRRMQRRVR